MNIEKIINDKLLSDEEGKPKRERSGKYSPSYFGRCLRLQYWNRKDEPITNPPDLKGLKAMKQGVELHKFAQSHFPKEVCEITIETEHVKGRADLVYPDIVYDIKGCQEWQYKRYWNIPTPKLVEAKLNNWLQVGWYGLELGKTYVSLIPWVYGTYVRFEHVIFTKQIEDKVKEEVKTLVDIWDRQWLPLPKPRAFGGHECNYCSWKDKCEEISDGIKQD